MVRIIFKKSGLAIFLVIRSLSLFSNLLLLIKISPDLSAIGLFYLVLFQLTFGKILFNYKLFLAI